MNSYIVDKILDHVEDLDVRRELGLPPRKVKIPDIDMTRYRYVYFAESRKLMTVWPRSHTAVYYPIDLSVWSERFYVFNLEGHEYTCEFYDTEGRIYVDPTFATPIIIRGPIKFII
jgi:hypothetical protein